MRGMMFCYATAALFVPSLALAQATGMAQGQPSILQQISLAVGVPATILGAAYSWVLISKTRAETRKAEIDTEKARFEIAKLTLEREKMERELAGPMPASLNVASANLGSINGKMAELLSGMNVRSFRNQVAISLILRFVVLGLLQALLDSFVSPIMTLIYLVINYFHRIALQDDLMDYLLLYAPSAILIVIRIFIFVIIGLPLLRDLNKFLGIEMPSLRFWRKAGPISTNEA